MSPHYKIDRGAQICRFTSALNEVTCLEKQCYEEMNLLPHIALATYMHKVATGFLQSSI